MKTLSQLLLVVCVFTQIGCASVTVEDYDGPYYYHEENAYNLNISF